MRPTLAVLGGVYTIFGGLWVVRWRQIPTYHLPEEIVMSNSDESTRKIIEGWQQPPANSESASSHAIQDLVVGSALMGAIFGALILAQMGWRNGAGPILAGAGTIQSAIVFALVGLLVGLIGQWLATRVGSGRPSRM